MANSLKWLQAQIPAEEWEILNNRRKKLGIRWPNLMAPAVRGYLTLLEADPKMLAEAIAIGQPEAPMPPPAPKTPTAKEIKKAEAAHKKIEAAGKAEKARIKAEKEAKQGGTNGQGEKATGAAAKVPKGRKPGERVIQGGGVNAVAILEEPLEPTDAELDKIAQEQA